MISSICVPYEGTLEELTSQNWKVAFGVPLAFSTFILIQLGFVFKLDSPQFYIDNDDEARLLRYE